MSTPIQCPKCKSTQITVDRKGFSGKKAVAGAILTGGIGLLAGTIGSNKIIITCLSCGHRFRPGEKQLPKPQIQIGNEGAKAITIIFGVLFSLIGIVALCCGAWVFGPILMLLGVFFISAFISLTKTNIK